MLRLRQLSIALITAVAITTPILTTSAQAQSSGAPSSFSGPNFIPSFWAIGLGTSIGSFGITDTATNEYIKIKDITYLDLIAAWQIAETIRTLTYWQMGLFYMDGKVTSVTQSGGNTFNTTGSHTDQGAFVGIGAQTALGDPRGSSSGILAAMTLAGALSLGYGQRKFDAFNGSFNNKEDGVFLRAEANVNIPISPTFSISPGVIYHAYDGSKIDGDNFYGVLRATFRF